MYCSPHNSRSFVIREGILCNNINKARKKSGKNTMNKSDLHAKGQHSGGSLMPSTLLPTRDRNLNSQVRGNNVQWVGMTPLEWIDSLTAKTEAKRLVAEETLQTRNPLQPLMSLGKPRLTKQESPSFTTPPLKHPLIETKPFGVTTDNKRSLEEAKDSSMKASPVLSEGTMNQLGYFPPDQMPIYWDFAMLEHTPLVESIRLLVLTVECDPNFLAMKLPFERTRDHFIYSVGYIRKHTPDPKVHLDMLYHETIHKLNALVELSHKMGAQQTSTMVECTKNQDHQIAAPSPHSNIDLNLKMNSWLLENWINPYPDEDTTNELARVCGTTTQTIYTWLVNARTRKWRPAIEKAFEMKRPAELLLEDSIQIFNGEPVRKLEDAEVATSPNKKKRRKE